MIADQRGNFSQYHFKPLYMSMSMSMSIIDSLVMILKHLFLSTTENYEIEYCNHEDEEL